MNKILYAPIPPTPQPSALLTHSDLVFIEGHGSLRRRCELTTWRSLLREALVELGYAADAMREIRYDANRAPYLVGSDIHFGVSHSQTTVAVIVSKSPCAVDIEDYKRNFTIVARRFTTPEEMALIDVEDEKMILPIIWSAKETLYKISRRTGLDLIKDLEVVKQVGDRLECRICYVEHHELQFTTHDGHVIVHTL